jgi:hypothetical protein
MVPKPRNRETLLAKPIVAQTVTTTAGMLRAVAFDDEAALEADEIDDVCADRSLTAPFRRLQSTIP